MKTIFAALPLVAALAVATPAFAQDATPSAERNFNIRAELNFGYDEVRTEYVTQNFAQKRDIGMSGFASGAEVGADARLGGALTVGAYAALTMSQVDDCRGNYFGTGDEFCFDAGTAVRAGGRVGLLAGDNGVIYLKGGLSRAKLRASYRTVPTPTVPSTLRFDGSDTAKGWHLGGGAELDMGRSTYIKAEYNWEKYGRLLKGVTPGADRLDPSRHLILFGFGVRIGAGN
jgi:opacity protein-like surface antigen